MNISQGRTNITIVHNSLKTVYLFRKNYIINLIKDGNKVYILAPMDSLEHRLLLIEIGAHVIDMPYYKGVKGFIFAFFFMNAILIKHIMNRHVLICHFLVTFIMIYPAMLMAGTKGVVSIEGLGTLFSKNKSFQKVLFFFLHLTKNKRVFCNNDERMLLGKSEDLVLNGIGVDLNKFSLKDKDKDKESFNLLFVGRLINDKGVNDAIEIFHMLLKKNIDVHLVLIGESYPNNPSSLSLDEIEKYKKKFGSRIRFEGFKTNVVNYYSESDILLLPSKREGFPVCVMEASSVGIPTIAYDVPGCRDAIIPGVNGYLASYQNKQEMYENTIKLLDKKILESMRRQIRKYAENNFDINSKSRAFITVVKCVCQ